LISPQIAIAPAKAGAAHSCGSLFGLASTSAMAFSQAATRSGPAGCVSNIEAWDSPLPNFDKTTQTRPALCRS